jgi:hypothetical protein
MGIPEFLPGTKLERINVKNVKTSIENQPKVLLSAPPAGARKKATKALK